MSEGKFELGKFEKNEEPHTNPEEEGKLRTDVGVAEARMQADFDKGIEDFQLKYKPEEMTEAELEAAFRMLDMRKTVISRLMSKLTRESDKRYADRLSADTKAKMP